VFYFSLFLFYRPLSFTASPTNSFERNSHIERNSHSKQNFKFMTLD
jgi:hypothetical protein